MTKNSIYSKTFISLLFANMFFWMSNNFFLPTLPLYYHSMGMNDHQVGLAVGVFSLGAVGFRLYAGKAADRYGATPVITAGIVISVVAIASYSLSITLFTAILARAAHGMGISGYSAAALTTASLMHDEQHTTEAVSMYTLFTMFGMGIAASSANWLYDQFSFLSVIIAGIIATILSLLLFPRNPKLKLQPKKSESLPLKAVIRNPGIYVATLSLLAINICFGSVMTFLPLLILHLGVKYLTIFYVCYAIAVILSRAWVSKLCVRLTAERLSSYVLLLFALTLAVVSQYHSGWLLGICGLGVGVSYGLAFPAMATIVTAHTQPANRGTAFGFFTMAVDIGFAIGAIGMGLIAGWWGYSAVFIAASAYTFIYVVIYRLFLKRKIETAAICYN